MCGLAGYINVPTTARKTLVDALGEAIETRGEDASGYVAVNGIVRYGKSLGGWTDTRNRFRHAAATGDLTLMHSRLATCGDGGVDEAHPFAIRRNGRSVLWGAHNGVLSNARQIAKAHNRPFSVDSKELFELMADKEDTKQLTGYGAITWITARDKHTIRLARLTNHSELEIAEIEEGGYVYGSTRDIVNFGLKSAGLTLKTFFKVEVGREYRLNKDKGIYYLPKSVRKVSEYSYSYFANNDDYGWSGNKGSVRYTPMSNSKWEWCAGCRSFKESGHKCDVGSHHPLLKPSAICSKCHKLDLYGYGVIGERVYHNGGDGTGGRCDGFWEAIPKGPKQFCNTCGATNDYMTDPTHMWKDCRGLWIDTATLEPAKPLSRDKPSNEEELDLMSKMEKEWDERCDDDSFLDSWQRRFLTKGA